MSKLILLGAGNVSIHLYTAFSKHKKVKIMQVFNHKPEKLAFFTEKGIPCTTKLSALDKNADFYILALKDESISPVIRKLPDLKGIVMHTSGAIGLETLAKMTNFGVFYPLQSFSKERKIDFKEIPICIEANTQENLQKIKLLAGNISETIQEISSEQRKSLHAAAVFVNNFTNHLYSLAAEICQKHQLPFEVLKPLLQETANKATAMPPKDAQTGPALRNDEESIAAHLTVLTAEQKKIYKTLTASIQHYHGKKL